MALERRPSVEAHQPLLRGNESTEETRDGYGASPRVADSEAEVDQGTFTKNLGAIEAFGIIVSIVIGSGIFTSPGSIDTNVPSPGIALVVWLVGGVLAWTGATAFAELGTAIPGEGGIQPWLQHMYGDIVGYMAGWTWIVAIQPSTLAIDSIVFVESIYAAAGIEHESGTLKHKLIAVVVLVVISIANMISTKASTRLNSFFVIVKFAGVLAIVVAGGGVLGVHGTHPEREVGGKDWYSKPWFEYRKTWNPDGTETDWGNVSSWEMFGHFSAALYAALWAYSGWDKAIYVSAELRDPARQLPLAINAAIPIILVCFLLANAAYYVLLPWNVVSSTDSVAVEAIARLLGHGPGISMAVLICVVVAGALLGNSFVVSRMTVAAAKKRWLPGLFQVVGRLGLERKPFSHPSETGDGKKSRSDAPINAVILSIFLGSLFILFGEFRTLLTLNGLGEYVFFLLTVVGALILRYREPQLHRPYKPLILFPILFVIVATFVVVRGATFAPGPSMLLLGVWILGFLFRWVRTRYFGGDMGELRVH